MNLILSELTEQIIGGAIEVQRELGPGLLESAYQCALSHELTLRKIEHAIEVSCPIRYKGLHIEDAYRIDILVGGGIVVELKAIEALTDVHEAQVLTYLRFTGHKVGLLFNFRSTSITRNMKRLVLEKI